MSYIERQTSRITGDKSHGGRHPLERKKSAIGGTGKVPNAKKPRSRPPTSLRDKLGFLHSHLPSSSGPYSVGSMDIEVPVEKPRIFSNITRGGKHVLQLETVLFTLYYPAAIGTGRGKDPGGRRKWSRETWLSRPRVETAKGYAKFAGLSNTTGVSFFALTTMLTKLRAFRNAHPATHWPPEGNRKQNGHRMKDQRGEPPAGSTEEPVFPLLLFSHGLGGSRTCYSTMCTEFASYGFIVCAVEHRDGSGPRSIVNHPKAEGEDHRTEWYDSVDHTDKERQRGFDKIDYIFPKNNPKDTSPNNEKGVDRELRNAQIELRIAELEAAFGILREINQGRGGDVAQRNLRKGGYVGGSSRGLDGVDWVAWENRFYVDKITVAGHSFGAATIVEVLRNTDRFENVQAGIIYDIWGAPIKPPQNDPKHRIHLPILGINSEAFMYWQANFDAVMSLMEEAKEQKAPAFLATVRGSVHVSQSDFSILYNHIVSFFFKSTVNPQRAIDLNISASLEFLRDVTDGAGKCIIERCLTDEELLQAEPLSQVPVENKPDDAYIAARLKVKKEFRTRLVTKVQRKMKRAKAHSLYDKGDEMWIHCRPNLGELKNWRIHNKCTTAEQDVPEENAIPESPDVNDEETFQNTSSPTSQDACNGEETNESQDTWLGCHPALQMETTLDEKRSDS